MQGETKISLTEFKERIKKRLAGEMTEQVEAALKTVYGPEDVVVVGTVDVDLDDVIEESITYIPSGDDNTGVISHSIDKAENQQTLDSEGGVVGTETNSEATSTTTYESVTDGNTIYSASEKDYEYLVSQITKQVQDNSAKITGKYITVYLNRPVMSEEAKASLTESVANSIGTDSSNVRIEPLAFYTEEAPTVDDTDPFQGMLKWVIIAAAGALLLAIILIIIIVLVKKKKKKKQEAELEGQMETIFGDDGSIISTSTTGQTVSIEAISTLRENQSTEQEQLQKEIQEFAGDNPEIAAHLIRQWLRGEDT